MKKVRFGAGNYNGFGGKVGDKPQFKDESVEDALVREGQEEFNITITDFKKVGEITFIVPHNSDWGQTVHIFTCQKWEGEPQESEEMRPEWFNTDGIPYEKMWDDDKYWLPKILGGETIKAMLEFDKNNKIAKYEIEPLDPSKERK